jgi:beta-lactam-binding protein with PASTA domain
VPFVYFRISFFELFFSLFFLFPNFDENFKCMGLKRYFSGKSGAWFWGNIAMMIVVFFGAIFGLFGLLGEFTHNGEKIEVPSVIGSSVEIAERTLENSKLRVVISDSMFNAKLPAGAVIEQTPRAGNFVKSGRRVYLIINMRGEPMVKFPDIINNSSLREAEAQLTFLNFSLTPPERVYGQPRDFVVGVRQGLRNLHAGEMVSRERALTIVVGAGELDSTEIVEDSLLDSSKEVELDF